MTFKSINVTQQVKPFLGHILVPRDVNQQELPNMEGVEWIYEDTRQFTTLY